MWNKTLFSIFQERVKFNQYYTVIRQAVYTVSTTFWSLRKYSVSELTYGEHTAFRLRDHYTSRKLCSAVWHLYRIRIGSISTTSQRRLHTLVKSIFKHEMSLPSDASASWLKNKKIAEAICTAGRNIVRGSSLEEVNTGGKKWPISTFCLLNECPHNRVRHVLICP